MFSIPCVLLSMRFQLSIKLDLLGICGLVEGRLGGFLHFTDRSYRCLQEFSSFVSDVFEVGFFCGQTSAPSINALVLWQKLNLSIVLNLWVLILRDRLVHEIADTGSLQRPAHLFSGQRHLRAVNSAVNLFLDRELRNHRQLLPAEPGRMQLLGLLVLIHGLGHLRSRFLTTFNVRSAVKHTNVINCWSHTIKSTWWVSRGMQELFLAVRNDAVLYSLFCNCQTVVLACSQLHWRQMLLHPFAFDLVDSLGDPGLNVLLRCIFIVWYLDWVDLHLVDAIPVVRSCRWFDLLNLIEFNASISTNSVSVLITRRLKWLWFLLVDIGKSCAFFCRCLGRFSNRFLNRCQLLIHYSRFLLQDLVRHCQGAD